MTEYAYPQLKQAGSVAVTEGGMELRDAFAIAAFGAVIGTATNMASLNKQERSKMLAAVAGLIYEAADIMIEQRKATK